MLVGVGLLCAVVLAVAFTAFQPQPAVRPGGTSDRFAAASGVATSNACRGASGGTYHLTLRFEHLRTTDARSGTGAWSGRASAALSVMPTTPARFVERYCVQWVRSAGTFMTEHTICTVAPVKFKTSGKLTGVFEGIGQAARLAGKAGLPAAKAPR